jgi:NDP-sugar pyrophosphorylase family protein
MRKTRISMTISGDVLKKLDSIVDGETVRSRSEAIEGILNQYLEANKVAVFLGGGNLERLMIGDTLKPLLKIRGKCLIEHNVEGLKKAGFSKMYVIGKSELIGECFKLLGNGSKHGVSIDYIEESKTLGNAKTLQLARPYLKSRFLVLPVDNFFNFDLNYLARAHMHENSVATLAVQANRDVKTDLGVVEMVGNQIIGYEERPDRPKTFLAATFIGIYEPKIFEYIPCGKMKWVLQTSVFGKLIADNALYGCIVPGFYSNIDTINDVKTVEEFLLRSEKK